MVTNQIAQSRRFMKNGQMQSVSSFLYFFYTIYLLDFFLHITQRVPVLGVIRLTALTFVITWFLVLLNKPVLDLRPSNPITKKLNALLIYIAVTLILTSYPGSVIKENMLPFLKAISFFYFTVICVDTKARFAKTIAIFVGCQVYRAIEPLYMNITQGYWGSKTFIGGEFSNRLSGSPYDIVNANELGFVIVTAMPFLYFLYIEKSTFFKKMLGILAMGALLYALILTQSRGAMVALGVVFIFIYKRSEKKGGIAFLGILGLIGALAVMSDVQRERYLSIFGMSTIEASNNSSSGRVDGMLSELKLGLTTRPILGNGVGTTAEAKYHKYGLYQASHNFYAQLLIEIGIVGFIFFLKFIKSIHQTLVSLRNRIEDESHQQVLNTLYVVFIMYAVYSINYYGLSQYYWYLLGGLVVASVTVMEKEKKEDEK